MALGSTHLTKMSTKNFSGLEAHKADNLVVICEPIV
jgi:hypothetical protein